MSRPLALTDICLYDKIKSNNEHKTNDIDDKLPMHIHTHIIPSSLFSLPDITYDCSNVCNK